ncbi:MAG: SGNH/GDSL hydrolase family protein, partial [Gemmataceae bacterium]
MRALLIAILFLSGASTAGSAEPFPPLMVKTPPPAAKIQRAMHLLSTSTAEKPNMVRILFYGQSITEQDWWKEVLADLKTRFPHAKIIAENRALAGYSSQLLVQTAESDLYPFEPDLLIFHVYGAHDKYEAIIKRTRERTIADILLQTDHVVRAKDFTEETDPQKLPPKGEHWDAFMNHNWLPSVAKKYGAELCDQRSLWKSYLTTNKLEPKQLLRDDVHLNKHGEFLMGECVKASLRVDADHPWKDDRRVRTYRVGENIQRKDDGSISLEFTGNRVEIVVGSEIQGRLAFTIDNKKPSEWNEAYIQTRAIASQGGKWPVLAGFGGKGLVPEDWTMKLTRDPQNPKRYTFTIVGAKTGPDGSGATDAKFVSKSGRVVILPEHWHIEYALMLSGITSPPAELTVRWSVQFYGADECLPQLLKLAPGKTSEVKVIRGIPDGVHQLRIQGAIGPMQVRVYRPSALL